MFRFSATRLFRALRGALLPAMAATCALMPSAPASAQVPRLLADGPVAIDLLGRVEWMRCTVGQTWDGTTCTGEPLRLSLAEAREIIARLEDRGDSAGAGWRLPTRDEFSRIIEKREEPPMIHPEIFPETPPESHWTSEPHALSSRHHWSVNFFTGHSYGRSMPEQPLVVRLVRDRTAAALGLTGN